MVQNKAVFSFEVELQIIFAQLLFGMTYGITVKMLENISFVAIKLFNLIIKLTDDLFLPLVGKG